MIKAAFITQHAQLPWKRQLPSSNLAFDGVEFFVAADKADIIFVYDDFPLKKLKINTSKPAVFIASEPKNVKIYNPQFLAQFDAIITSDRATSHPNPIFCQAGLNWHVGMMAVRGNLRGTPMSFQDLEAHYPRKTKNLSVVSSNKSFTAEHRARLDFVKKLKDALGDQVDVFGRGIFDFPDKRDVLDDYRYHVALENCSIEDYWTEKLADPYLTLTFPIYHGCPNVKDYFSEESFRQIDIHEPDKAIATIREVINSDLAERSTQHLLEARRRVMHEHNVFAVLARVAKESLATGNILGHRSVRELRPEQHFWPVKAKLKLWLRRGVERAPMLRKALRPIKIGFESAEKEIIHQYRCATDIFYRSHQNWISDNPQDDLRFRYPLPKGANVLDVGGYTGDFAAKFLDIYGANVTVLEPIPTFASQIQKRFANEPRVHVHVAGLSDKDEMTEFDLDGDASGAYGGRQFKTVQVALWDAERFLSGCGVTDWHLAKLNIEGGEFALLNRLIDTGRIGTINFLQVQFHLHVPNARQQYKRLAKRLSRTHQLEWRYPFVWESWARLDSARISHGRR